MSDLRERLQAIKTECGFVDPMPDLRPTGVCYRLLNTSDPEERLEDAAMWKAMHDEYGEEIQLIDDKQDASGAILFGRHMRYEHFHRGQVHYWNDPAFLSRARRSFVMCDLDGARHETERLHAAGKGAFVKAMQQKQLTLPIPVGTAFNDALDAMAYSFCDRGVCLMVQELVTMEYEHRFFVIDRQIVTSSPIQWALTPLDHDAMRGHVAQTPKAEPENRPGTSGALWWIAVDSVRELSFDDYSLDVAIIDGEPGIVELNPMHIGNLGLYAADVRALAKATRGLVRRAPAAGIEGREDAGE